MTDQSKPDRQDGDGLLSEPDRSMAAQAMRYTVEEVVHGLPTRDAAEVAQPSIDWLAKEIAEKATLMMTGQTSYLQHIVKCAEWIRDRYAATPKPAPDAMRNAARKAYSDWAWNKKGEAVGNMLAHEAARVSFCAGAEWGASFSAPVPSPDGHEE